MHCWARYLLTAAVAVLGFGQSITACGQKGELYLPEPEPVKSPAPPAEEVPPPGAAGAQGR
jgi:predicted small lipoprotein YifL